MQISKKKGQALLSRNAGFAEFENWKKLIDLKRLREHPLTQLMPSC